MIIADQGEVRACGRLERDGGLRPYGAYGLDVDGAVEADAADAGGALGVVDAADSSGRADGASLIMKTHCDGAAESSRNVPFGHVTKRETVGIMEYDPNECSKLEPSSSAGIPVDP